MDQVAPDREQHLEAGFFVRAHGVRGDVRLRLYNPASSALRAGESLAVVLEGEHRRPEDARLTVVSQSGTDRVVRIDGITRREQADQLRGIRVLIGRDPSLEDGQFYYADLVGCSVFDCAGCEIGRVHKLFEAGASDILVVRDNKLERYIPFVEPWLCRVDLASRRITVSSADSWEAWPFS